MMNKKVTPVGNLNGEVIYDVQRTGHRYMTNADMQLEARLLGLTEENTAQDLLNELTRRGLADYSPGRAIAWGQA